MMTSHGRRGPCGGEGHPEKGPWGQGPARASALQELAGCTFQKWLHWYLPSHSSFLCVCVESCPPKIYVQVLVSRACECDHVWKRGFCRCDRVKTRSWSNKTVSPYEGVLGTDTQKVMVEAEAAPVWPQQGRWHHQMRERQEGPPGALGGSRTSGCGK